MTLAKDPFPEMQAGISSRPLVVFSEYARRCRMSPLPHLYRDLRSPVPRLHQDSGLTPFPAASSARDWAASALCPPLVSPRTPVAATFASVHAAGS